MKAELLTTKPGVLAGENASVKTKKTGLSVSVR